MSVGKICVREVRIATPDETVGEAARRMAEGNVGTLVVVDAARRPIGVLTDRDVTVRCVAPKRDAESTAIASVMSAPVECVHESTAIEQALEQMARVPARRLVVRGDGDRLVGILALDDVLELLVEETASVGRLLRRQPAPPRR